LADALVFVRPETVIAWRRRKFRHYWTRLCRSGKPGRPSITREVRDLIRRVSTANPLWEHPVSSANWPRSASISPLDRRQGHGPPSSAALGHMARIPQESHPGHRRDDFFVVPTVRNPILFVFLILAHERRRVLHFKVTAYPSAEWTAPSRSSRPSLGPTRPSTCSATGTESMGWRSGSESTAWAMKEVLIAPQSPWQNPYVERLIGSIRRECLDHTIVLGERHLKRVLTAYFRYDHRWRTHISLEMDSPRVGRLLRRTEVASSR